MLRLRGDGAGAHAGDGGDQFESGSRRIGQLQCAVEPGTALVDRVEGVPGDERAQIVEVVTGMAGDGQHLARADVERDRRAGALAQRSLGSELQIDIDAGDQILPFFGGFMVEQRILKTKRVDAPHLPASQARKKLIK